MHDGKESSSEEILNLRLASLLPLAILIAGFNWELEPEVLKGLSQV